MLDWLHIPMPPAPLLFAQLLVGLINGAFYAMLSLGLAVIFGLLNIINFTHGAQYMLGAFCAWFLLNWLGIGYGPALVIEGIFRQGYGSSGQPYNIPPELQGAQNLGFMFLPTYRAWVIVAS